MQSTTKYLGFHSAARRHVERLLLPVDRVFNALFGSKFNPIYRSGTVALGLLVTAIATGLYLVFFYRLGEPYESLAGIDGQLWAGRWIRSVHRYASDGMVISVVAHLLRMAVQGKTWGPRALAWITGVGLTVSLFISGWTGFVLVWDVHAQALAATGAAVFDSIGFLAEPLARSFNGSVVAPPAGFFFLNLFVHIVVPLAMVFGVWVHTSRMARATWFPHRRLMIGMAAALIVASIFLPAPLLPKADLLAIPGRFGLDWVYNFWVPLAEREPRLVFILWVLAVAFACSVPFWFKPSSDAKPEPAFNDPKACQGCGQCVKDCPYEAIRMIPREGGRGPSEVALVTPELCVSCGLCSASCMSFTMGPPERKGSDQMATARAFTLAISERGVAPADQIVVLGCSNQASTLARIRSFVDREKGFCLYPVECAGTVHASVFEHLARSFYAVAIAACPERNCTSKDGFMLLSERLSGERSPSPGMRFDRTRLPVHAVGEGEEGALFRNLLELRDGIEPPASTNARAVSVKRLIAGVAVVLLLGGLARIRSGTGADHGTLRLSWRLPGQSVNTCRTRTPEELARIPIHMRQLQDCTREQLSYRLVLEVDGRTIAERQIRPGGYRADRPLYVDNDVHLTAGMHQVRVRFEPENRPEAQAARLGYEGRIEIQTGRIALIQLSPDLAQLVLKTGGSG